VRRQKACYGYGELDDLREKLRAWLDEYTRVLQAHGLPLPFPH